jgi:hypothetical protein
MFGQAGEHIGKPSLLKDFLRLSRAAVSEAKAG